MYIYYNWGNIIILRLLISQKLNITKEVIKLRKILGWEDFRKVDEISKYLNALYGDISLNENNYLKLFENSIAALWLVATESSVYIVRDKKTELKVIYDEIRENFSYKLLLESRKPRIFIDNTTTTLPINNKQLSNDLSKIREEIDLFLKDTSGS